MNNILSFSFFLICILLLVIYFWDSEKRGQLKLVILFGIFIGISSIVFKYYSNSCFGASTPTDIKTQNLTNQNLKIYTIVFWGDNQYFVNYDKELKPNETSEFCIDSDGGEFWLVAKNEQNKIFYLEEARNEKTEFIIVNNQNVENENVKKAKKITLETDNSVDLKNYLMWANCILTIILVLNFLGILINGNQQNYKN